MALALLFLFLQLAIAGLFLFMCLAFVTGGPFVPSKNSSVQAMVNLAHIKQGQVVYDVGSGDGRVLFAAAKEGAYAVGLEINPYLVAFTNIRAYIIRQKNVKALWKNLWQAHIGEADIVFVYLFPWRMEDLAKKLQKELKPGSLVISNSFIFPNWKRVREDRKHHIYVFQI